MTSDGGTHTTYPDGTRRFVPWQEEDYHSECARLWYKQSIWAQRIEPGFRFEVGTSYLTLGGDIVEVLESKDECVRGDDGIWRYNRAYRENQEGAPDGLGRTTGSSWDRLTNLIPVPIKKDQRT